MDAETLDLFVVGVNHKTADTSLREKLALSPAHVPDKLETLIGESAVHEVALLSTCNRTEVYTVFEDTAQSSDKLFSLIRRNFSAIESGDRSRFYFHKGRQAVHHLLGVTSGLDSMILGEPQIGGQVKDALRLAQQAQTIGVFLNRLFHLALHTAKTVRSETAITRGAVSVAYAAVELAEKVFKDLSGHSALLIGAGKTGRLAAKHLKGRNIKELYIANRTLKRAEALAAEMDAVAMPFEKIADRLHEVDIVIGSTGADDYVLQAEDVRRSMSRRNKRYLFFIDIAMPRDFDPAINSLNNVFLNNMEALRQVAEQNALKREQELPVAYDIVDEAVDEYQRWRGVQDVKPTIVALRKKLGAIRRGELDKFKHRVDDEEMQRMEELTHRLLNKILHFPMRELNSTKESNQQGPLTAEVLRNIFELKDRYHEE